MGFAVAEGEKARVRNFDSLLFTRRVGIYWIGMRRRKNSSTSILRDSHERSDVLVDNVWGFLKRKIPALGSLLIGILVGLLVAQAFNSTVRPVTA